MKLRATGVHLNIHRRAALKAAIGLGAAMVLQPIKLFAQSQPLIRKRIAHRQSWLSLSFTFRCAGEGEVT
jgi:hypothetical protein